MVIVRQANSLVAGSTNVLLVQLAGARAVFLEGALPRLVEDVAVAVDPRQHARDRVTTSARRSVATKPRAHRYPLHQSITRTSSDNQSASISTTTSTMPARRTSRSETTGRELRPPLPETWQLASVLRSGIAAKGEVGEEAAGRAREAGRRVGDRARPAAWEAAPTRRGEETRAIIGLSAGRWGR